MVSYVEYIFWLYVQFYFIPAITYCVLSSATGVHIGVFSKLYLFLLDQGFRLAPVCSKEDNGHRRKWRGRPLHEGIVEKRTSETLFQRINSTACFDNIRGRGMHYGTKNLTRDPLLGRKIIDDRQARLRRISSECIEYIVTGLECIIEDDISPCFQPQYLSRWNFLLRTRYQWSGRVTPGLLLAWFLGALIRYAFVFPLRLSLVLFTCFVSLPILFIMLYVSNAIGKMTVNFFWSFNVRLITKFTGLMGTYHHEENRPPNGALGASNHTCPTQDMGILCHDHLYSAVAQRQGGMVGYFMNAMNQITPMIFFERGEMNDRKQVVHKCREYMENKENPPVVLFPEGCCSNNTAILRFRKNLIGVLDEVYPIAIRYDCRYGNASWLTDTYIPHLLDMMTSWATVFQVWFLPPVKRLHGEDDISFTERVRTGIAEKAELKPVEWAVSGKQTQNARKLGYIERQQKTCAEKLLSELNPIV